MIHPNLYFYSIIIIIVPRASYSMNPVYGSFLKTSGEIVSEEKINNDEDKNTSLGTVSALLTREEALAKVQAILKKRPPPVSPLPMPIHIENLPQTLDPVSLRDKPQIDPFSSNSNDVGLIQMMERMRNAEIREPFAVSPSVYHPLSPS